MAGSPLLVTAVITGAVLIGLVPPLIDGIERVLGQRLGIDEKRANRFDKWFSLASILGFMASGIVIDAWGAHAAFYSGAAVTAFGMASLAISIKHRAAWGAILITGLSHAFLTTACVSLMAHPWVEKDLTCHVNLGFIFVGLGMLAGPVFIRLLNNVDQFRNRTLVLSLLALAPAILMAMVPAEQLLTAKERNLLANLWTEPHLATKLALAGLIAFLFCPLEGSLSLWGRTFLADLYPQPRTVHWIMAGYWLAYLVSRLAMAMIPHNGYEMWIILALALVAAVTFGNLRGAYNPASGALAFILIGGLIGPIFPTLLAVGLTLSSPGLQAQATEQASAVAGLFALGTLGNLLFQPPLRAFAKSHAVRLSLRVPMILALILGIPLLILALIRFQM